MDKIGEYVELPLNKFIGKIEIVNNINNGNYTLFTSSNEEIIADQEKERITEALIQNLDFYYANNDKFFITESHIGLLCDEVAHKGDSFKLLIPR